MIDIKQKLPTGWKWVKLGEVCASKTITKNPKNSPTDEFTYIDISSIDNENKTILSPERMMGIDAPSRARRLVYRDDIILSTTRPNLNAVAKITDEFDGQICSTGFCVLRPLTNIIDKDYLFLICISPYLTEKLTDLVKGALYPAVTDKQVFTQEIPLPPLPQQKRIAGILTKQMAAVEKAKAACQEKLAAAEKLPAAYLNAIFNSDKAKQWPKKKLGEVCVFKRGPFGGSLRKEIFVSSGYKVYEQQNAIYDNFDLGNYFINKEKYQEMQSFSIKPSDLLVSCSGTMGCIAIVPKGIQPGIINQALLKLTPHTNYVEVTFLKYYIESESIQMQYFRNQAGAAIQNVASVNVLKTMPFPDLSLSQQKYIANKLAKQLEQSKVVKKTVTEELELINKLPASFLQQAFSGNIN